MMACEVAFTLFRTPTKIARIRAAEYTNRPTLFGAEALAVDVFISPEQLVTEYVERLIHHPGTLQVLDFADGKVRLVGVRARAGRPAGRPAACASCREHLPKVEARVVAIYRDGRAIPPEGDTVIDDGDEVFFLAGARGHPPRHERAAHAATTRRGACVIAGGGNIGLRLARTLEKHNQVKLIERDATRARARLRAPGERHRAARRCRGRGAADRGEHRQRRRVRGHDQLGRSQHPVGHAGQAPRRAQGHGAHQQALVRGADGERARIDIAISPQTITIGSLLAHVRRGDVVRVHSLRRGAAEALEAVVHGDERSSRVVGRRGERDPAARGRLHRRGGARRGGHHGAPRHARAGRRPRDPVPRRPPPPGGGRAAVPAARRADAPCSRSRTSWDCCSRPSRSPTCCPSAARCSWAMACGRSSCWRRRWPPPAAGCCVAAHLARPARAQAARRLPAGDARLAAAAGGGGHCRCC